MDVTCLCDVLVEITLWMRFETVEMKVESVEGLETVGGLEAKVVVVVVMVVVSGEWE